MKFWKKRKRLIILVILLGVIILNVLAWMHARSMMHFSSTGEATKKPEDLSAFEKLKVLFTGVRIPRPENTKIPADYKLDFETHYFPGYAGHTLEAWYIPSHSQSTGKLILLFHGYAKAKDNLLPLASEFYKMGYSSFLVDFYGSGGSGGDSSSLGVYEADDVTAAFRYAVRKWPNNSLIFYGVSMGSAALLRAISRDGLSPAAVVIESSFNRLLVTVKNRFKIMGLPSFPAAELLVLWGGVQQGFNAFKHNPAQYAKSVTCPALVLHGELDKCVSKEEALQVFENLSGRKYFKSYPGVGHQLLINLHKEKWRKDLAWFFKGNLQ